MNGSGERRAVLCALADAAEDFGQSGTRSAHARLTIAIESWSALAKRPVERRLVVAISAFKAEMGRRESVENLRVAADRIHVEALGAASQLASIERHAAAPTPDRLTGRKRRLVLVAAATAIVVAGAVAVTLRVRSREKETTTTATTMATSKRDVAEYLAGPGRLVMTFRELSAPVLTIGPENPDRRLEVCRQVADGLNASVDPVELLQAAAAIPDSAVAEYAVDERSARSRLLVACGAEDSPAVDEALRSAIAADELFTNAAGLR